MAIKQKKKKATTKGKKRSIFRVFLSVLKWVVLLFFGSSLIFTLLFKFVNPPVTVFMVYQTMSRLAKGEEASLKKKWVDIEDISPRMIRAVIASEDNLFVSHWGIDTKAVKEAVDHNKKGKRMRGGSTISQQTAKNVFLWPSRTFIRKGLEFYFTMLIEQIWGKKRIMEVYLNVIETGNGMYGVEAAAQKYFRTSSSRLSDSQAALIASSLPSPRRYNPANPGNYLTKRKGQVMGLMYKIETLKLEK